MRFLAALADDSTRNQRPRRWRRIVLVIGAVILWLATAYPRGMLMAYLDCSFGYYEIQTHGYPIDRSGAIARLLKQRYAVTLNHAAGCTAWPTTTDYIDGYNVVSSRRMHEHFGKDVFHECALDATKSDSDD